MSDFAGDVPRTMNTQSKRYLYAAGAVGAVFLLALLTRKGSNAAPQPGGEVEDRTLYVPTTNETTIINYQSNNPVTTNTGGGSSSSPGDSPPILSRLDPRRVLRRVTSGAQTPVAPISGQFPVYDTIDAPSGVQRLTGLDPAVPRTVASALPSPADIVVRTGYGRFFQDSPSDETLDLWRREYDQNRDKYPTLTQFENAFNLWASRQ